MQQIISQLKYTSNIRTIDLYLRIVYDETIAIKYLPQLSLATQYSLLRKGSNNLMQLIINQQIHGLQYQTININNIIKYVRNKLIISSQEQPQYQYELLQHIPLHNVIKLHNKYNHQYFNDHIKNEILNQIEDNGTFNTKSSTLLKWLHQQNDTDYMRYLPLVINQVMWDQQFSNKAHKYIGFIQQRISTANITMDSVDTFLQIYVNTSLPSFLNTKNTKHRILLKLKLIKIFKYSQCQQYTKQIEQDAMKYQDLSNIKNINFYTQYDLPLDWLLQQILEQQIVNQIHKVAIINLINHILRMNNTLNNDIVFNQMMEVFEPEDIYYTELKVLLEYLLIAKQYPQQVLVSLMRIFADKHLLFDVIEFQDIILIASKFGTININDEEGLYKNTIYQEVREYYVQNALSLNTEVHSLFLHNI